MYRFINKPHTNSTKLPCNLGLHRCINVFLLKIVSSKKLKIKSKFDCFVLKALVHESFSLCAVAGLLTYSHFEPPSHLVWNETVAKDSISKKDNFLKSVKMLHGTYSNGLVQDLHLIPS